MSIKTQKILQFFPIFNIIILYFWVDLCLKKAINLKDCLKDYLKVALFIILVSAVRISTVFIFENQLLNTITVFIYAYLLILSMCWLTIRAEERAASK